MPTGHGGARTGAGRKPASDRKIKRSVALSPAADAVVLAAQQPGESYTQTLDRVLCATRALPECAPTLPQGVQQLLEALSAERERVAVVYRRLGWSRQQFEQVMQTDRILLAHYGVQLHVATKDAASGPQERYITVDGMRYSAISRAHGRASDNGSTR